MKHLVRFWEGYTVLNVLGAGKDAGWMAVMILICVTTFAISSIFVHRGVRRFRT